MKRTIYLLLIITLLFGCKNKEEAISFKNTIKLSIQNSNKEINLLIKKSNEGLKSTNFEKEKLELEKLYKKVYRKVSINKKILTRLEEVSGGKDLKKKALDYLNETSVFLKDFFKPILSDNIDELGQDNSKVEKMFNSLKRMMNQTQKLYNTLEEFCIENNIEKEITNFDIRKYDSQVKQVEKLINEESQ